MIYFGDLWFALQEDNLWGEGGKILLGDKELTPDDIIDKLEWIASTKDGFTDENIHEVEFPLFIDLKDNPLRDKPAFASKIPLLNKMQENLGDRIVLANQIVSTKASETDKGFAAISMGYDTYMENLNTLSDVDNFDMSNVSHLSLPKDYNMSPSFIATPLIHIAVLSGYNGADIEGNTYTINTDVDEGVLRKLREATLKARCALTGEDYNEFSHLVM